MQEHVKLTDLEETVNIKEEFVDEADNILHLNNSTNKQNVVIQINHLWKQYQLGSIGYRTLQEDLQEKVQRFRVKFKSLGKKNAASHHLPNTDKSVLSANKKNTFWSLSDINLHIYEGETLGIIGSNGAGKSTLLKILSRITAPTIGSVHIKGKIASMLEVGTGFHRELTGRDNIYLNGAILGMSKSSVQKRFDEIVAFSEIGEFIDTPVKRYSSGMYVKLAFSVAAHLDADILIMDEVLAVGDLKFQEKCIEKMRSLAKENGKTVLYVSHNMETIRTMCDRCIVLEKGELVFIGDTEEAIRLYYGRKIQNQSDTIRLEQLPRLCELPQSLVLQQLRLENHIISNQKTPNVLLHLSYKVMEALPSLYIRITIQSNSQSVGTYHELLLEDNTEIGNYETKLSLDTSTLFCGKYFANIGVYKRITDGKLIVLDYVKEAFSFEIIQKLVDKPEGKQRFWGNVHLPISVYQTEIK